MTLSFKILNHLVLSPFAGCPVLWLSQLHAARFAGTDAFAKAATSTPAPEEAAQDAAQLQPASDSAELKPEVRSGPADLMALNFPEQNAEQAPGQQQHVTDQQAQHTVEARQSQLPQHEQAQQAQQAQHGYPSLQAQQAQHGYPSLQAQPEQPTQQHQQPPLSHMPGDGILMTGHTTGPSDAGRNGVQEQEAVAQPASAVKAEPVPSQSLGLTPSSAYSDQASFWHQLI